MKERPILFSTEMVQAILAGRKTQTRRVVKPQPTRHGGLTLFSWGAGTSTNTMPVVNGFNTAKKCPYGQVCDLIYVKETYFAFGRWIKNGFTKSGRQKWKFKDETKANGFEYQYMDNFRHEVDAGRELGWHKRPSLFMPNSIARIWLRITDVRVERLHEINHKDALSEGIERVMCETVNPEALFYKDYCDPLHKFQRPDYSFMSLWQSINGSQSWNANPWVWVIEFEVISKTGKP